MPDKPYMGEDGYYHTPTIVESVYYSVDRFGKVFNAFVRGVHADTLQIMNYPITETLSVDILQNLLLLRKGDELDLILFQDGKKLYYEPSPDTLIGKEGLPACIYCGNILHRGLGTLNCPNDLCIGRMFNRIVYFIRTECAALDENNINELQILLDTFSSSKSLYPGVFTDLVTPWFKFSGLEATFDIRTNELLEEFYSNVSNLVMYYPDIDDYFNRLVEFIMSLSIPELTRDVVSNMMEESANVKENPYILQSISNLLAKTDPVKYKVYIKDLESFVNLIYRYNGSRDGYRDHQFTD